MAKKKSTEQPFWVDNVAIQDKEGHEVPDPRPVSIPAGFQRPPSLQEQVRRLLPDMIRQQQEQEVETWEDANDFDVGDDFDPSSPWETIYDPTLGREVTPEEFARNLPQIREEVQKKLRNYYRLLEQDEELAALSEKELRDRVTRGSKGDPPSPGPSSPPKAGTA